MGGLSPAQEDALEKVRWFYPLSFPVSLAAVLAAEVSHGGRGGAGLERRQLLLALAEGTQVRLEPGRRHAQEGEQMLHNANLSIFFSRRTAPRDEKAVQAGHHCRGIQAKRGS